jgi:hypothetical protein
MMDKINKTVVHQLSIPRRLSKRRCSCCKRCGVLIMSNIHLPINDYRGKEVKKFINKSSSIAVSILTLFHIDYLVMTDDRNDRIHRWLGWMELRNSLSLHEVSI